MTAGDVVDGARQHSRARALLIAGLALAGLSMRTAVTSVGAVLDELQQGLHVSGTVAGLITTLPVICFAVIGVATTRLGVAVGAHRLLVVSLAITALGLALRPWAGGAALFVVLSVLALAGAAVSNVLLPGLVKLHFPDRLGAMTALYTTALAIGATGGAGLTVPLDELGGGWRAGLAWWTLPALLAAAAWLPTVRRDAAPAVPAHTRPGRHLPMGALLRSRTAWAVTLFFGTQSIQAYIAFGWFSHFLIDHGVTRNAAGGMVALLTALGIPVSLAAPRVRPERQRALIVALCGCSAAAYVGLALAPVGGAWAWMALAGIGQGVFPVALVVIGLRSRTAASAAALSAFAQGIGYSIAGLGPLLFGALFAVTGSWGPPLAVLFAALAANLLTAWPATAHRFVDDEMAASQR
ncbi:MAG TPA: MFS transporter [Jatrophihabitans sp.]|nr:MFS transporter [Jatrophihabitans sp.]